MKLLIAALGLAGCDRLLDLHQVDPPTIDAFAGDGTRADDGTKPTPCGTDGTHDEDGDGMPDSCDLCPTVKSDNSDMDGDGVGDQCDPRAQGTDKIDGFYPFVDTSNLATSGVVTAANDALRLDGASIETVTGFVTPEWVTVGVKGFGAAPSSASIVLTIDSGKPDAMNCELDKLGCPQGAALCIFASQGGASVNTAVALAPTAVETLTIYRIGNVVECGVNDVTQFHSPPFSAPMPSGTAHVEVPIGPLMLPNLIVYNVKP